MINMTDSKFVEAKSEVTHLVEAMKNIKNSTGFDADRLNIIYKEVWHGSTDYRSMRFGIEFIPNSNDHKAVPGLVIELINRNPPDVDQYVNAIVGTQKKVDSVEYDWLSVRPNLEFRFYDRPSTNHLAIDISKTDESFISFLNVGIKERSTAEKLEILFKVADRLRTFYIQDLQNASMTEAPIIATTIKLLDSIAHVAMMGMKASSVAIKPRTESQ